MKKENIRKIKLIKKYAKIRFKRFWKEWGFSKRDMMDIVSIFGLLISLYCMYIIGSVFI